MLEGGATGAGDDMDSEDERTIEEEFKQIYEEDEKLRSLLGGTTALS